MENEELSPYEYEVAISLEESLITTLINISQIQDVDMLDSYYNFLTESIEEDTILSLIADAYVWLKSNDTEAFKFLHPIAIKLVDAKYLIEVEKAVALEEAVEDAPPPSITAQDVAHLLLEEGYLTKKDYRLYKKTIRIFNPGAVKFLAINLGMDTISDFVKVCLD